MRGAFGAQSKMEPTMIEINSDDAMCMKAPSENRGPQHYFYVTMHVCVGKLYLINFPEPFICKPK